MSKNTLLGYLLLFFRPQLFSLALQTITNSVLTIVISPQRLQTALHIAAEHGRHSVAEMILIAGVNLRLLDKVPV